MKFQSLNRKCMECGRTVQGRLFCNMDCSQAYTRSVQQQEADKMIPKKFVANYGGHDRNDTKLDRPTWLEIREQAYKRDGYKCVICGHSGEDIYSTITGDHITPRSIGGKLYDLKNIWTLCNSCNAIKTAMDDEAIKQFYQTATFARERFVVRYRQRIRKWARDLKKSCACEQES